MKDNIVQHRDKKHLLLSQSSVKICSLPQQLDYTNKLTEGNNRVDVLFHKAL